MNGQPPTPPPSLPTTKSSGLAIASLVLGILGLVCVLPLIGPILAVIFGSIAISRIGKSGGLLTGRGQAMTGIILGVVGIVMIPIMAALLLPAVSAAREKARRVMCLANEKQIAMAVIAYRNDTGNCPQSLGDLRKYVATEQIFHCPSALESSTASYSIFCVTNADEVMVSESPANHRGAGSNVAYADGHVEWKSDR